MSEINIFKIDELTIIIHIRAGNIESTNTYAIKFAEIRSISIDNDRIRIYHGNHQNIYNINGQMAVPIDELDS